MILRKGGRRVAKQGEVFQRCCRWFGFLFIRDCKRTFGVIASIMAYATTTFLCGNTKIRARGWLSSPLLRSISLLRALILFLLFSDFFSSVSFSSIFVFFDSLLFLFSLSLSLSLLCLFQSLLLHPSILSEV